MSSNSVSTSAELWSLWQLLDSALPTGGFAHSAGVEAAWQHGLLRDGDDLTLFLRDFIQQLAVGSTPIALAVLRATSEFEKWDGFYDAATSNHVANRASRAQGRALLATVAATYPRPALADAEQMARTGVPRRIACHLPAVFGLMSAELRLSETTSAAGFLFLGVRAAISSAVRLGLVGPMEGQRIQAGLSSSVAGAVQIAMETPPGEVTQTAFFADLLQGTQDRLYSRLFQS